MPVMDCLGVNLEQSEITHPQSSSSCYDDSKVTYYYYIRSEAFPNAQQSKCNRKGIPNIDI